MLFSFSSACPVRAAILFRPKTSRAGGSRAKHAKNSAVLLTDTPTFFWRRNQSIPAFTRVPSLRFASFRFKIQVANLFRKNFKQICNGPISKLAASRMNERVKTLRCTYSRCTTVRCIPGRRGSGRLRPVGSHSGRVRRSLGHLKMRPTSNSCPLLSTPKADKRRL